VTSVTGVGTKPLTFNLDCYVTVNKRTANLKVLYNMFGDRQLPHAKYELLIENKRQVKLNLSCEKV